MPHAVNTPDYDPTVDVFNLEAAMSEELATQLTCSEAEAYARLLCWAGRPERAAFFLGTHGSGDGAGDQHVDHGRTVSAFETLVGRVAPSGEEQALQSGRGR
jgi:hypothetical protein